MSIFNSLGSNYNFNFVLKSLFTFGGNPDGLEKLLEEKYGGKPILLYKGREAIELALQTLNLSKASFVAINGFTCFAVYDAVKKAGLNVEYLDIERGELNFSADILKEALEKNPKIKTVIIQNTLGYPCDIEGISKICREHNLILIEDLAHSIGTKYANGAETGSVGEFVVLSFSQDKMIDAVSGGALIKRSGVNLDHLEGGIAWHLPARRLIDRLYPLFTYLIRKTYPFTLGKILHFILKNLKLLSQPMNDGDKIHKLPGWYGKLIKIQFDRLIDNLNHRKIIASIYAKSIDPKILSPNIVRGIHLSSNLRFPIFIRNRETLIKYLAQKEIYVSDIWYDAPIAPKKYLQFTNYFGQCPNAELASAEILNLPTNITVSEKDAERISELVNLWLQSK